MQAELILTDHFFLFGNWQTGFRGEANLHEQEQGDAIKKPHMTNQTSTFEFVKSTEDDIEDEHGFLKRKIVI